MLTRETLQDAVGSQVGCSDWVVINQDRISAFADVTEDWQAIHLDPEAARAAGFDGTVAHGFLSLSMLSMMAYQGLPTIEGQTASLNYGFDRIRFLAPVPAGARLRSSFELQKATPRGQGWLLSFRVTVEIEGQQTPAITADWLILFLF